MTQATAIRRLARHAIKCANANDPNAARVAVQLLEFVSQGDSVKAAAEKIFPAAYVKQASEGILQIITTPSR